ncbi:Xylulose-1,5-bisphosphate phosphatase CbbY, converts this Rubisco inhibiting byproduct to xylulose-5P [hydrothermal vent metagenome]|uniref:Xylulose-1,5-bisphosphate phosphatase CbbY, converts this Rubisco inhibiting byproduct to xylulose-5P n=1 Tax=hydrothermal vent metagenome TaxID=652676 RepID=A0A3B1AUB6_9ZZZZ
MKQALQALLFDVDGTLADTERDGHRVAFNLAFQKAGLDWDWSVELYGKLLAVTGGKERMKYYLQHFNTDFEGPDKLDAFIAELHQSKTTFYTDLLAEGRIPLRPGVERLLKEARAKGMRMGIATTTTPANVQALLTHTLGADSESWFEVIAAGDVVPAKKPAADIYTWAMEKMGLSPEACIAFEDSENGIKSSVAAGLRTIITVNDYTLEHDFSDAVLVLNNMGEPDQAFTVLQGDENILDGANYLDLELVQRLAGAL